MKIIVGGLSTGQGPLLLVPPHVIAHHEDAHRRFVQDSVVLALQPVVVPPKVYSVQVQGRGVGRQTEVMGTHQTGAPGAVLPRANDQLLAIPGFLGPSVFSHTHVVAQGATQKDVVPSPDI